MKSWRVRSNLSSLFHSCIIMSPDFSCIILYCKNNHHTHTDYIIRLMWNVVYAIVMQWWVHNIQNIHRRLLKKKKNSFKTVKNCSFCIVHRHIVRYSNKVHIFYSVTRVLTFCSHIMQIFSTTFTFAVFVAYIFSPMWLSKKIKEIV